VYSLFILDDIKSPSKHSKPLSMDANRCKLSRQKDLRSQCIITFYNFKVLNVREARIGLQKHLGRSQQLADEIGH
jgi:hypothetical protein